MTAVVLTRSVNGGRAAEKNRADSLAVIEGLGTRLVRQLPRSVVSRYGDRTMGMGQSPR